MIKDYAREAGVRNLRQLLEKVSRKALGLVYGAKRPCLGGAEAGSEEIRGFGGLRKVCGRFGW